MIEIFFLALFLTLIIARIISHSLDGPDKKESNNSMKESDIKRMKNVTYSLNKSKRKEPRTLTHKIRKRTAWDFHHLHIGLIIYFIALTSIILKKFTFLNTVLLAVGLSLILDQIVPLFYKKINYFSRESLFWSIFLHVSLVVIYFLSDFLFT